MAGWAAALSCTLIGACTEGPTWSGSLEKLMRSQPGRFATVMENPEEYRVQVIYTQIDRDADNRPSFTSFKFRANADEYFYPASTVKLPTALMALEKLNALDGVDRDTVMITGVSADSQIPAMTDPSSPTGLPSVGHYIRKILLVSDNDAFNRLYEFLGQEYLNETMHAKGYRDTRILHRLEVALSIDENRLTNPLRFEDATGIVYEQGPQYSSKTYVGELPIMLGKAEVVGAELLRRAKDFSEKNAFPLQDLHDVIQALMFPDAIDQFRRFDLTDDDYRFVYSNMSSYPGDSGISEYDDPELYPDGYVKFLMFGGDANRIPDNLRIFNKVGDAYGFLTDAAYIIDLENNIEFILAATIYTNANGTFNDDNYEYDEIGLPFLRDLGQAVYEVELNRERPHVPDLSRFSRLK
jgi:hypothetical protein